MGGGSSSPKYMDEIRIYSNHKEKEKFEINKKDNYHKFFCDYSNKVRAV